MEERPADACGTVLKIDSLSGSAHLHVIQPSSEIVAELGWGPGLAVKPPSCPGYQARLVQSIQLQAIAGLITYRGKSRVLDRCDMDRSHQAIIAPNLLQ
jgi:hypothetical protein